MHKQCHQKRPLHINMDETSVKLLPEQGLGYLSAKACVLRRSPRGLVYSAPRGRTRSAFSYVCLVADDLDIQRVIPQVLMVSKKVVPAVQVLAIRRLLPPNIHIWHMDSAWTTTDKMIALIRMLKKSLAGKIEDRQIILTADCFRAHITQAVWKACKTHNIFYAVIPAKMTWALQPCDTHVFASLKRNLQQKCQEAMIATADGSLTTESLFACLVSCIGEVVCSRSWTHAFRDTGLQGDQSAVSARVLNQLGFVDTPLVGNDLPTLQMLQSIFPKNAVIPIMLVFGCFLGGAGAIETIPVPGRIVTRSVSRRLAARASASYAPSLPPQGVTWRQPGVPLTLPEHPSRVLRLPMTARLPASSPPPALMARSLSLRASSG